MSNEIDLRREITDITAIEEYIKEHGKPTLKIGKSGCSVVQDNHFTSLDYKHLQTISRQLQRAKEEPKKDAVATLTRFFELEIEEGAFDPLLPAAKKSKSDTAEASV